MAKKSPSFNSLFSFASINNKDDSLHCLSPACHQGSYGKSCNSMCHCLNGGSCDPVTGKCLCPLGVNGQFCEDGLYSHILEPQNAAFETMVFFFFLNVLLEYNTEKQLTCPIL